MRIEVDCWWWHQFSDLPQIAEGWTPMSVLWTAVNF